MAPRKLKIIIGIILAVPVVWGMASFLFFSSTVEGVELKFRDGVYYRGSDKKGYTGKAIERYANGVLKSETRYKAGKPHGVSQGYYENGELQIRETFRNGVSHGTRTKWYETGSMESEGSIVRGQFDGYFRKWDRSGQMVIEMQMEDGLPHGLSRSWYAEGPLRSEVHMDKGKEISRREFENGRTDET